ncbi:xyloglucan O-acetyltransferase 2-like [Phragmites australis]|uniref:xyloglucan O-acetyltransferase 2-like n=1 Tax=Phragmites australis TaxID=29695 RepID=UPI002D76F1AD|nr:xyloglucan O-acetyltransferase 2-like [Phragmites australis]
MGASTPRHHLSSSSQPQPQLLPHLTKRIITFVLYALIPLAILHYLLSLSPLPPPPTAASSQPSPPQGGRQQGEKVNAAERCDYSDGEWVRSAAGPRYNGTSCGGTIKAGQNCMAHGRPDTGYLHWRWRPRGCALPPFDPAEFLVLVRGRHVAFVGDSLARNQCESLVCLLSSAFPAQLVRGAGGGEGDGDGDELRKFRRWAFPSHNATVSVFWSPFLVNGTEKSKVAGGGGLDHNRLYFDQPDERWAAEIPGIDVVVLSAGHWFLHPAMYYDRGAVIGCHHCPEPNRTETGFFGVFRLSVRNALREVATRSARAQGPARRPRLAVVTTFSPAHFEGQWDSPRACARTEPYAPGERELGYMDAEMLRAEAEEAAAAGADASARGAGVAVEALQVTRLAAMRADGHPGPYMHAFPFAGGERERVPNDCVHWCLPGPIDTWNEILLQVIKRWADGVASSSP